MNSKNSKTSGPHRPLLNRSDEINLKKFFLSISKYVALSNLSVYYA